METLVAFLILNRPDTTEKVFEAIRQAQPSKRLVADNGSKRSLRVGSDCKALY